MAISTVRRLASDIMNVGESRIRISTSGVKDAQGALTRADVRNLIEKGIVIKLPVQGRASTRKRARRGEGHKRGIMVDSKDAWMQKVRSQRKFLKMLISEKKLDIANKWDIYGKIKSGIFRSKRALLLYLKDNGLISKDYEIAKKPVSSLKSQPSKPKEAAKSAAPVAKTIIEAKPPVSAKQQNVKGKEEKKQGEKQ